MFFSRYLYKSLETVAIARDVEDLAAAKVTPVVPLDNFSKKPILSLSQLLDSEVSLNE